MVIRDKNFTKGTHIMAILNITPDSFFPASRYQNLDIIFKTIEKFINDGAEVIDIGGQSTHPNGEMISWEEELNRVIKPIIEIRKRFDIPLSIDTFYSQVAEATIKEGVDLVNDVTGLQFDDNMINVIAKYKVAACLVHNSRNQKNCQNTIEEIVDFFKKITKQCIELGVDKNKICLDGGIGFGKTIEQNWYILNNYEQLGELGYPLLIGTSRKSFLEGNVDDRLQATLRTTEIAVKKNIMFIRVHDVKENFNIIKTLR